MSTFMQLMEGKRGADVVESVRVSKTGTMFFKMNGKEVIADRFGLVPPSIHARTLVVVWRVLARRYGLPCC